MKKQNFIVRKYFIVEVGFRAVDKEDAIRQADEFIDENFDELVDIMEEDKTKTECELSKL